MNEQDEHDLFITDDVYSCWAFCGSIHNLPRNDNILLLMDRFNVSSRYGNLVLKLAKFLCQFFGEGPQFAVVVEYTCNVCVESSDLILNVLLICLLPKICIQCFERIHSNFFLPLI